MSDQKDFFISYNKADRHWAEWIAWELEEVGYTTVLQAWDFRPGGNFVIDMQRAMEQAERTIAVLSLDYLASKFTQPEWAGAFAKDPTGEKGLLVPVRVRECDLKGLLPQIVYIDFVGTDEAAAANLLHKGVQRGRVKPTIKPDFPGAKPVVRSVSVKPRFPTALPPVWNVPRSPNPNFVGRDELLAEIHQTLTAGNAAALTAIHGLGGVGKTQLAAEYAHAHKSDYEIVWWLRAEDALALAGDYAALAARLDLPEKEAREQAVVVAAVREWLGRNSGWLLVFDNAPNAEGVREFLPPHRAGHVLITSRDPNWRGLAQPLEVRTLALADAAQFLLKRTGRDDAAGATPLAYALGCLPLALEQAGAYIETSGRSFGDYLKLFQTRRRELMQRGKPADYPDTVATTWEISFQAAEQQSAAAAELLHLCAFLAPDDIPLSIVRAGAEHLPAALAAAVADELSFDDAIAALRRYSLIEIEDDAISVHRLVQMVARDRLSEEGQKKWAEAAVRILDDAFPFGSNGVRTWPECQKLLPHATVVAEFGEAWQLAPETTARLLNQTGLYLKGLARFTKAKKSFERALCIIEAELGPDHPNVASGINNLGLVLQDLGELAEARSCIERALRIDETAFGPDHPSVASDVNNLGVVLRELGELAEARNCIERALRIDEATFGLDHSEVAIDVNNLGLVLEELGELAEARRCFERALLIIESTLGADHPYIATFIDNLGLVLQDLGELAEARSCHERALRIDEATFGPDHPNVATRANNLGFVLQDLGELAQACQCFERALRICRHFLGEDHPDTVRVRKNLEGCGNTG